MNFRSLLIVSVFFIFVYSLPVNAQLGKLLANITPSKSVLTEFETPTGVASIRGTTLSVDFDPLTGVAAIDLSEGNVVFVDPGESVTLDMVAGDVVRVEVPDSGGGVLLNVVTGDIEVQTPIGDVIKMDAGDEVQVSVTEAGDTAVSVTVAVTGGEVTLAIDAGDITMDVGDAVTVTEGTGGVGLEATSGEVTLETGTGDVVMDAGDDVIISVDSESGNAEIGVIGGDGVDVVDADTGETVTAEVGSGVEVQIVVDEGGNEGQTDFVVDVMEGAEGEVGVTDGSGSSDPDGNVSLSYNRSFSSLPVGSTSLITGSNTAPVADADTDQDIYLGETAPLNGTNSYDPDGTIASYTWAIDSAPVLSVATLSDPNIVNPTLAPDLEGQYIISLVVNDGVLDSAADTVAVNVTLNLPPVAVATGIPTTGDASLSVDFDASRSSDPESGSLIFYWDFGDPASGASNTSTLINPTHIYSDVGNHTAVVTVTDDFSNTDQASVEIEVTAPNMPPTVAPTATVDDFTVQFVANANDPEGDPLTYTWDFSDSTALSSDVNPTHIYNNPYTYTATVTVSDGEFDVSGDVIVSVFSSLEVDVFEANVNSGKKGKVKGKINLKAYVCFEGLPLPSDIIKVDCDGITLIEEPFGSFEEKVNKPGIFKYKEKNLHGKIDFSKSKIEVSRHKMLLNGFDNSNGVDVFISFGLSTGSDHILMKKKHGDDDSSDDDHRKRWYYKEKHHHANCDDMDPVPCPPNCQR